MDYITGKHIPRRTFLRGMGATVALPLLDGMVPAMTALAGFVPCADAGMRQTFLCCSPRSSWYAQIVSRPVYSP